MIVEFAGLPGAGKSTLRDGLAADLRAEGVPVTARHVVRPTRAGRVGAAERAAGRALALASRPRVAAVAGRTFLTSGRPARERLFAARLLAVTLDNDRCLRDHRGWVLVDEGFVQRGLLLMAGERRPVPDERVRAYATVVPVPDVVVHLRLDPDRVQERLRSRPRGLAPRFARLGEADLRAALADAARVLGLVVHGVEARGSRVIGVDAADLDAAAGRLRAELLGGVRRAGS